MSLELRDSISEGALENTSTIPCLYKEVFKPTPDNLKDADSEDDKYQRPEENEWFRSKEGESSDSFLEGFCYRKKTFFWEKFDKSLKIKRYLLNRYEARSEHHRSNRPYKCEMCGIAFVTSVALRLHIKSHYHLRVPDNHKKLRVFKLKKLFYQRYNYDFYE
ncbi:transcription factor E4F1-like [Pseudomyrmex gracilis]|uniref:transcription factor E4F1-like n=1 Tax=Pseudomyrmex gracilis TaxID=219809 RepID=UPI0009950077|nr:transcription factor E4F1-like [Pseudomyrmex gracilis]XP_020288789.1 transcription factor E4F1-like [Pseudomyrmex gracilis]